MNAADRVDHQRGLGGRPRPMTERLSGEELAATENARDIALEALRAMTEDRDRLLAHIDAIAEAVEKEADDYRNAGIRPLRGDELRAWNYVVDHFSAFVLALLRGTPQR